MPNYNLSFTACSFHVKKAYTPQTCAYDLNKAFPVTREGMPKNMDISELFSMFVAHRSKKACSFFKMLAHNNN